jgi:hypothetical protein
MDSQWKAESGFEIKSQYRSFRNSKWSRGGAVDAQIGKLVTWTLKVESWRVCGPVVTDSRLLNEEQDPDPH